MRRAGKVLLGLAMLCVIANWYVVWSEYRREVERQRFVFGSDAEVLMFNPLDLVNPPTRQEEIWAGYIAALVPGTLGVVCLILARPRPRRSPQGISRPTE
jgi:hypothetical protein